MRRTIASVAVAAASLAPASSFAECAWVLWEQRVLSGPAISDERWTILRTYEARPPCAADFAKLMNPNSVWHAAYEPGFGGDTVMRKDGNVIETKRAVCVPGSIDPRGPKGK